jgi:hypothetical protein
LRLTVQRVWAAGKEVDATVTWWGLDRAGEDAHVRLDYSRAVPTAAAVRPAAGSRGTFWGRRGFAWSRVVGTEPGFMAETTVVGDEIRIVEEATR